MVEQDVVRFSDFHSEDFKFCDEYSLLIPVEVSAEEILELSVHKGFKTSVRQVDGHDNRRIVFVDPGINLDLGRAGVVAFYEQDGKLYMNSNDSRCATNLFLISGPLARKEGLVG